MKSLSAPVQWGMMALAAVGIVALYRSCGDDPADDGPIIPPAVDSAFQQDQRDRPRLDSIQAAYIAESDSLRGEIRSRDRTVLRLRTQVAVATTTATRAADTARVVGDTLSLAWEAYEAEHARADLLDSTLATVTAQRAAADSALVILQVAYDTSEARRVRVQQLADDLREAVDVAARRQECRIAGLIKCPTRRQSFIGGAVLATAALIVAGR